jgi:hypothetical protein
MKRLLLLTILLSFFTLSQAQDVYKFAVEFTDKEHTPFSLDRPQEFLSQRSIERRARAYVQLNEQDLPIDPIYIADVLGATSDAKLIIQVKWLNTIIISLSDSSNIDIISKLPSISNIEVVYNPTLKSVKSDKLKQDISPIETNNFIKSVQAYDSSFYGGGWVQIHQLMGEKLHERNYRGEGKIIAVLDAGFINVDSLNIFKNLWNNNQIIGTKNFVNPDLTVFGSHYHGTMVLSTMGGYWEGQLVGTAPDASYFLMITEDGASENIIEEYNWVAGAAFADSLGADVLNTSLGYIDFDDSRFDHTYDELDGNTTVITRGANMAYRRGMLPVNSAGNSGNSAWRYIGAPADAIDILSIGAVDGAEVIASFSSHGFPWSDDVKPDVVARGSGAYVSSAYENKVGQGNGTSFSGPILAGMATSLWSASPNLSPYWIKQAIQRSADRYMTPDTLYGYGLPNFEQALNILGVNNLQVENSALSVYPNPIQDIAYLDVNIDKQATIELSIYDIQGREIIRKEMNYKGTQIPVDLSSLNTGIFILEARIENEIFRTKINKR